MFLGVGFLLHFLLLFIWGPFLLAAGFGNSKYYITWSRRDINSRRSKNTCFVNLAAKSGGIRITSAEAFDEVLHATPPDKPIQLVLFTAAWCGPCRLTLPVVKEIRDQFQTQLEVYEINTDDLAEVAENCGVVSIPTILLYHRGSIKDRIIGCVAKNVLAASVAKLLEDFTSDETNSGKQK